MRFISLQTASEAAVRTARRFPLALLSAIVAGVAAQMLVDNQGDDSGLTRVLLAGMLGIPLFVAVRTTAERAGWPPIRHAAASGAVALLLIACWWVSDDWSETMMWTRGMHLLAAGHLLAATLPFVGTGYHRAFWQYNRILFQKFLIATLFTLVLFAGLALAITAIENLFDVDFANDIYEDLFLVLAFLFHPWFTLGSIPEDLTALEGLDEYPAGLKVFGQYILIPVVTLYLAILTAYLFRVLITRIWPSGWIGWLVSGVAAVGTLALLLVHPARDRADSRWVDAYGRWFFVALIPAIGMLLVAIGLRVNQYGFTEQRYLLLALALWLAGIALWYAVTASRRIRLIPESLCVVALITFIGPWSAYDVSRRSQAGRLTELLERNALLSNSELVPPADSVSFEDRMEIAASVRYLLGVHGPESLNGVAPALRDAAARVPEARGWAYNNDNAAREVVSAIGIRYTERYERPNLPRYLYYSANPPNETVDVRGWDFYYSSPLLANFPVPLGADTLHFAWSAPRSAIDVSLRGTLLASIQLDTLLRLAESRAGRGDLPEPRRPSPGAVGAVPPGEVVPPVVLDAAAGPWDVRLIVKNFTGEQTGTLRRLTGGGAGVLVRRR